MWIPGQRRYTRCRSKGVFRRGLTIWHDSHRLYVQIGCHRSGRIRQILSQGHRVPSVVDTFQRHLPLAGGRCRTWRWTSFPGKPRSGMAFDDLRARLVPADPDTQERPLTLSRSCTTTESPVTARLVGFSVSRTPLNRNLGGVLRFVYRDAQGLDRGGRCLLGLLKRSTKLLPLCAADCSGAARTWHGDPRQAALGATR